MHQCPCRSGSQQLHHGQRRRQRRLACQQHASGNPVVRARTAPPASLEMSDTSRAPHTLPSSTPTTQTIVGRCGGCTDLYSRHFVTILWATLTVSMLTRPTARTGQESWISPLGRVTHSIFGEILFDRDPDIPRFYDYVLDVMRQMARYVARVGLLPLGMLGALVASLGVRFRRTRAHVASCLSRTCRIDARVTRARSRGWLVAQQPASRLSRGRAGMQATPPFGSFILVVPASHRSTAAPCWDARAGAGRTGQARGLQGER